MDKIPGFLSVPQAGPQVDLPRIRPARALAHAPPLQQLTSGLGQFRRAVRRDFIVGIQAVQRRAVTVGGFPFPVGLQPFLQHAVRGNLVRGKPHPLGRQFAPQRLVHTQDPGRSDGIAKQFPQLLHVDGRTQADAGTPLAAGQQETVFRRGGRAGHQPLVFRFFKKVVQIELHAALHHRIHPSQVLAIQRKGVLLPQVFAQPGRTADIQAGGCRIAPDIRQPVRDPTPRVVVGLGGLGTGFHQRRDEGVQRLLHLDQVTDQRRPVVHLGVDVKVVVAVPHGVDLFGPDALQVGRQAAGTRRADQQVAAHVRKQGRQGRIGGPLPVVRQAFIRRQVAVLGFRQAERHAVEKPLVIGLLSRAQLSERFLFCLVEVGRCDRQRIGQLPPGDAAVIGRRRQQQPYLIGRRDRQGIASGFYRTAAGHHPHPPHNQQPIVVKPVVQMAGHQQLAIADRLGLEPFRAVQGHRKGDRPGEPRHEDLIGGGHEMLAGKRGRAASIGHRCQPRGQVQLAPVVLDGIAVAGELQAEVAQGLETAERRDVFGIFRRALGREGLFL